MDPAPPRLVWIDLVTTGPDPATCAIVEIASIVTAADLEVVAEGPHLLIGQPADLPAAEAETVRFLEQHCARGSAPVCGDTVWKDRAFLERHMPGVVAHLHYRMIDVATIEELVRRWYPAGLQAPARSEARGALETLRASIDALRWYRANLVAPAL